MAVGAFFCTLLAVFALRESCPPDASPPPVELASPARGEGLRETLPGDPELPYYLFVPERARVQVRVFDLTGRMVRTLLDREIDRGVRSERWDGTNTAGRRVAAGVYLIRMDAPGYTKSVKSVLLH